MSAKKEGLDYFPFSVDLLDDETLDILREEHGVVANDVYISLLCLLYKKKGYYIPYETEKEKKECVWFIYKRVRGGKYPIQQDRIPTVIESLVSQGLFSGRYFPKIITSERAQRTYYSATVDRKADSLNINPEYWLLGIEDMEKLSKKHPYYLSCTLFSKSDDLSCKSGDLMSKSDDLALKESKVKESKVNISPNPLKGGGGINWKDKFFERFTAFEKKNYKDEGIDYHVLYNEFEQSTRLQGMWSFPKVIKIYSQIAEGFYRDRKNAQEERNDAIEARADRERYYASLKAKAEAIASKNLEKARALDGFDEVVCELSKLEIEIAKAEVYHLSSLDELILRKLNLENDKENMLKRIGITPKDLLPQWSCIYCKDTGWLPDGKSCKCYKAK